MPVVDASVLAEYLAGGERAPAARTALLGETDELWAPHLVDAEVGHVIRRYVAIGELSARAGGAALDDLSELRLIRVAHVGLIGRAWELRANVSFYDGLYVALAEALEMPLLTLDRRLAGARGVKTAVEVVE